jgi:hypothetical protein
MSTYSLMLSFSGYPPLAPLLAGFLISLDWGVFRGGALLAFAGCLGLALLDFLGVSLIYTVESVFNGLFEVRSPCRQEV